MCMPSLVLSSVIFLLANTADSISLTSEVVELTVENFHETSEGLWLVEFYAP